ncbi:hypothetical protein PM082_002381 [Marasmius tenuissimus]|nr:hypothetical protein PM082_002381 [Marasmius tenuissimus]
MTGPTDFQQHIDILKKMEAQIIKAQNELHYLEEKGHSTVDIQEKLTILRSQLEPIKIEYISLRRIRNLLQQEEAAAHDKQNGCEPPAAPSSNMEVLHGQTSGESTSKPKKGMRRGGSKAKSTAVADTQGVHRASKVSLPPGGRHPNTRSKTMESKTAAENQTSTMDIDMEVEASVVSADLPVPPATTAVAKRTLPIASSENVDVEMENEQPAVFESSPAAPTITGMASNGITAAAAKTKPLMASSEDLDVEMEEEQRTTLNTENRHIVGEMGPNPLPFENASSEDYSIKAPGTEGSRVPSMHDILVANGITSSTQATSNATNSQNKGETRLTGAAPELVTGMTVAMNQSTENLAFDASDKAEPHAEDPQIPTPDGLEPVEMLEQQPARKKTKARRKGKSRTQQKEKPVDSETIDSLALMPNATHEEPSMAPSTGEQAQESDDVKDDPLAMAKFVSAEAHAVHSVWNFLHNPSDPKARLDDQARAHIRADASHCPEAGDSCFELAKQVLVTREGQLKCIYHHKSDKTTRTNDKDAGKKDEGEQKTKKGPGPLVQLPVGDDGKEHAHCGCTIEDAVWGFYLWKTIRISYGGRTQGYGDHTPPLPRTCNFMITLLRSRGVELQDVWRWRRDGAKYVPIPEEKRIQKQIDCLRAKQSALPPPQDHEARLLEMILRYNDEADSDSCNMTPEPNDASSEADAHPKPNDMQLESNDEVKPEMHLLGPGESL